MTARQKFILTLETKIDKIKEAIWVGDLLLNDESVKELCGDLSPIKEKQKDLRMALRETQDLLNTVKG